MTLEEAIKLKEEYRDNHYLPLGAKIAEADNLSIEALKRIKNNRRFLFALRHPLLPGETKE